MNKKEEKDSWEKLSLITHSIAITCITDSCYCIIGFIRHRNLTEAMEKRKAACCCFSANLSCYRNSFYRFHRIMSHTYTENILS